MSRLQGRAAVVTGAGRGIGAAIAWRLAELGASVCVNDINANTAQQTVDELVKAGHEAMAGPADVSDAQEAEQLIKQAVEHYGKLDILVNNAGVTRDQLIMRMPEEDWDFVLRVNLKSAYNCSKAAVRSMVRKRYGRIVNMASVAGIAGNPGQTNYGASKAGLIGFTKSLAREVGMRGITVNAVAPGYIPTDLTDVLPDEVKDAILAQIPLGHYGTTEDVANAVAFLASDEAAYITGQVLSVDGGMVMG
jgi:3-oxoacyl-[acyl-carrier protein] reductase